MRILIAEDQKDLNKILKKKLQAEGYTVDACFNGEEALNFLAVGTYDGAVLDINMPILDGLSVVSHMRKSGNYTPVLFLTARDTVSDRVTGLDIGANDYLVKPFSFEELMARIRALTRKTPQSNTPVYSLSDLTLDSRSHAVQRGGNDIKLSAKEFSLLEYLLRNKGRVLSREDIENNLWNFDYEGGTNAVDVYIRFLRSKLDDAFVFNTRLAVPLASFLPVKGEWYVSVENFTNQHYCYYPGYPMAGAMIWTGVKLTF